MADDLRSCQASHEDACRTHEDQHRDSDARCAAASREVDEHKASLHVLSCEEVADKAEHKARQAEHSELVARPKDEHAALSRGLVCKDSLLQQREAEHATAAEEHLAQIANLSQGLEARRTAAEALEERLRQSQDELAASSAVVKLLEERHASARESWVRSMVTQRLWRRSCASTKASTRPQASS